MFLKKGDIVDIVSPASSITKNELIKIENFLKAHGLRARFYLDEELLLTKKQSHNFPSFAAKKRFEQLLFALQNNDSKAVWCARGGYGSAEIIPFLQQTKKITQNKLFIGFSDITSLTIFLQQNWNWKIICAPMLNQLANNKVSQQSQQAILDVIFGKKTNFKYKLDAKNATKNISGKIVGGCLSVVASHFSTTNKLDWNDKILFIEDIDESGERLDRYFYQLIQIMIATKSTPRAILLGNYYFGISAIAKKRNIEFAIKNLTRYLQENKINIPVFAEKTKCLGHSQNMMPLPIGSDVQICDKTLEVVFNIAK